MAKGIRISDGTIVYKGSRVRVREEYGPPWSTDVYIVRSFSSKKQLVALRRDGQISGPSITYRPYHLTSVPCLTNTGLEAQRIERNRQKALRRKTIRRNGKPTPSRTS